MFPAAARTNCALVMCEVMMPDGKTPQASNKRTTILDDAGAWFGFEQEYLFCKDGRPLGFPDSGYPPPHRRHDRLADIEDDCICSDRREGLGRGVEEPHD